MDFKLVLILGISLAAATVMGKYLANEVDIDFKEDGKDYKEKIIFDDQKETTEYVVEKTARQGLIRVLADHKSGFSALKVEAKKTCYLMKEPVGDTNAKIRNRLRELGANVPSDTDEKKYDGIGKKVDPQTLPTTIQDFCGNFPIYELTGEKTISAGQKDVQDRQKRACYYVVHYQTVCAGGFCWTRVIRAIVCT